MYSRQTTGYLNRESGQNAVCFVLVGFGDNSVYRIPWHEWKRMEEVYGKKSIAPMDVQKRRVDAEGVIKLLDGIVE